MLNLPPSWDTEWIDTVSGRFWPRSPRASDICAEAIGHALANLCRFGGHTTSFYSVAQHSVLCAREIPLTSPRLRRTLLLHDAAEAYCVDLPTPIKDLLPGYRAIESGIAAVIARKFALPPILPEVVHQIDARMMVTEASQLMRGASGKWWERACYPPPFPNLRIDPWPPGPAHAEFMEELALVWPAREAPDA